MTPGSGSNPPGVDCADPGCGPGSLWPDGVVPVAIAPYLPKEQRVLSAMEAISARTAIRFIERRKEDKDYLFFWRSSSSRSCVGRQGGKQRVDIADQANRWHVVHEILHALGLRHEHCRMDRDHYVAVEWANIRKPLRRNFCIASNSLGFAERYDYDSIMHYGPTTGAREKGLVTIRAKLDPHVPTPKGHPGNMGQRDGMSDSDVAVLRTLYKVTI